VLESWLTASVGERTYAVSDLAAFYSPAQTVGDVLRRMPVKRRLRDQTDTPCPHRAQVR
jgi:hypothetical protein